MANYLNIPANQLVDMSTESKLMNLKEKANNLIGLLKKVQRGETEYESVETVAMGVENFVDKAQYQYHTMLLQNSFKEIRELIKEFSLTENYSAERLIAALESLINVVAKELAG